MGLTLAHDARQSGLELFFGLFHLLLVLTLLSGQSADVTVGGLDHGVEVVGVAAIDLASFQPGQKDAHCFWKLAVIWHKPEDREKKKRGRINEILRSLWRTATTTGRRKKMMHKEVMFTSTRRLDIPKLSRY